MSARAHPTATGTATGTVARKDDAQKPRIGLLPPGPLAEVIAVYEFGAAKYSDNNWKQGLPYSRWYNAVWRHVFAWWRGESRDTESKLHHLAHAVFGLLALMQQDMKSTGDDDREKWQ